MPLEPVINVCIPFDPGANLGGEYNRIMEESKREWVLFLDHDVLILNPHWYLLCQEAIRKHPDAGLFTAFGSAGGSKFQRIGGTPARGQSILVHRGLAKKIFQKHGFSLTENNPSDRKALISGFFMLTSKTAWKKAGGFGNMGLFAQDHLYHRRIAAAGLKCYRIDGIYCYHLLERVDGSWIRFQKTSKELWTEYWRMKRFRKRPGR
jgi:GT2 family glycosyltransferase